MNSINKRLAKIASFVEKGANLCDVGTDHAFLPIFLCKANIIDSAIATDIHQGPCEKAVTNIKANGLDNKIQVLKTDGLTDVYSKLDTVVIAGMGGELIWKIISKRPDISKQAKLILQPMTKISGLREALTTHGFEIVDEALVEDDRLYQIIVAKYTENNTHLNELELLLGPKNIEKGRLGSEPLYGEFVNQYIKKYKRIKLEKTLHAKDVSHENSLLASLKFEKELARDKTK